MSVLHQASVLYLRHAELSKHEIRVHGFCRGHRHFVLQRHVPRYAALRPGAKACGLHKGEAYFKAADVSELHTADKWVQHGREVAASERATPFKVVARRGSKKAAAAAAAVAGADAGDLQEVR